MTDTDGELHARARTSPHISTNDVMHFRGRLARAVLFVIVATGIGACSTGSSAPTVARVISPAAQTATGTVTIMFPPAARANAARRRKSPTYVSSATGHAALFINGSNTAAGSTTTCSPGACTISWTAALAVPAAYTFAVEIDTGPSGTPANTVLAENASSYVIRAGINSLAPLTLNGVAGSAAISGEICSASNCSGTLSIEDAAGDPITSPGAVFDNSSVTVSSSTPANGTITLPAAPITAVSVTGEYSYEATCQNTTGTFVINATSGSPSNVVTAAELAGLSPAVGYPPANLTVAQITSTYICRPAKAIAKAIFLTSPVTTLSTFTVPSDWNSANNSIEVIAGGGGGGGGAGFYGGAGGGAYGIVSNQVLTAGGTVDYEIGTGGAAGTSANGTVGGNTWFCDNTTKCTTAGAGNVVVSAKGGAAGKKNAGGAGGTFDQGDNGYSGGAGGATATTAATGGGGAAGPLGSGTGGAGGDQGSGTTVAAGGGGNGGGSAGQAGSGVGSPAGQGGNNSAGTGGGSEPGGAGSNGGGGGGGASSDGGAGGNGIDWSALYGSGGGGGASNTTVGGAGGLYGGGGGGSIATGGVGGGGLIVIIYVP